MIIILCPILSYFHWRKFATFLYVNKLYKFINPFHCNYMSYDVYIVYVVKWKGMQFG